MIANLSVWFALHVLFALVTVADMGPIELNMPDWATFDWRAGVLSALAVVILFALKWSIFRMLAVLAIAGLALGSL